MLDQRIQGVKTPAGLEFPLQPDTQTISRQDEKEGQNTVGGAGGGMRRWGCWRWGWCLQPVLRRDLTEKGDVGTKTSRGSHPAVKDERSKEMKWSVQRLWGIRGTARRLEQDG